MRLHDRIYGRVTSVLPPRLAVRVDLMRPSFRESWGGPLNGQARRREMIRELARAVAFDRVIETGTYRGTSTEFFAAVFGGPVDTVESNQRFFEYSRHRFVMRHEVHLWFGDSRQCLRSLAAHPNAFSETVFIYLDAHWEDDLPLGEELRIIGSTWPRAIVMIDDFQVPGDPGYNFDDYGPDARLTRDYLPGDVLQGWSLMYPSARSDEETGARRGCGVLVSPELERVATSLKTLRLVEVMS